MNIEELLPCSELIEIHDAAGIVSGGGSQVQLADEVRLIGVHSAPNEGEVTSKCGGRDGARRLG